jgi:hypothetical protein
MFIIIVCKGGSHSIDRRAQINNDVNPFENRKDLCYSVGKGHHANELTSTLSYAIGHLEVNITQPATLVAHIRLLCTKILEMMKYNIMCPTYTAVASTTTTTTVTLQFGRRRVLCTAKLLQSCTARIQLTVCFTVSSRGNPRLFYLPSANDPTGRDMHQWTLTTPP